MNGKEDIALFPFMDKINFTSYEEFIVSVDEERSSILTVDVELLNRKPQFIDLKKINKVPVGRFDTIFEGIYLECCAFIKEEMPLYIMLTGALTGKNKKPQFSRWSYYKYSKASILCISDPMFKMYDNLRLGWYYGNNDCNLRKVVADFVKEIAKVLNVDNKEIVFIGSSGGGSAVFECANYISGAKAVSINPQIVLKEYGYANEFSKITGNRLDNDQYGHRHNALHYIKNNDENPYLIIANIRSRFDMLQIERVRDELALNISYGLNIYNNLIIWLYDADTEHPHVALEYYCVWFFIEYMVKNMHNLEVISGLKSLYRLINEFWHDHWLLLSKLDNGRKHWTEILDIIQKSDKSVAVFGCGKRADNFLRKTLKIESDNYFNVQYMIDNDIKKKGREFLGNIIRHSSEIEDWNKLYVIITVDEYSAAIQGQLEKLGLVYKKDFIHYTYLD